MRRLNTKQSCCVGVNVKSPLLSQVYLHMTEAHYLSFAATANADYGQLSNFLFFAEDTSVDPSLRRAVNIAITDDERVEELREGFTVEIGFPPAPPPPAALSIVGGRQESAIEDNDGTHI